MWTFQKMIQPAFRMGLTAAMFLGVAGLGGCMDGYDHDEHGHGARYEEHDAGWHREHDREFEHGDRDRVRIERDDRDRR